MTSMVLILVLMEYALEDDFYLSEYDDLGS